MDVWIFIAILIIAVICDRYAIIKIKDEIEIIKDRCDKIDEYTIKLVKKNNNKKEIDENEGETIIIRRM